MSNSRLRPETIAAHALKSTDEATGAVAPPLYPSSTYARDENYKPKLRENYIRNGNLTLWHAEDAIAALENGKGCLLFASGMAAITTLLETVPQGAHVVAPDVMYYGTRDWLKILEERGRIALTLFDATKPGTLEASIQSGKTDLVWIETPLNPTWDVIDIAAAAKAAHKAGAILAVDATATAAVTTRPLELGADIAFHSATKYLNGHSDVLAGALVTGELTPRWAQIATLRTKIGTPLAPFEAWLLTRGLRTVYLRYRQASTNALAIAKHFERHPRIERVLYPGLASHRGHAIAAKQMTDGFGGMLSLLIKGSLEDARRFCTLLKVIVPATSLGGVETLAEHRKTVEGPQSPVPDNLVRISTGIEHADDLIADIEQALAKL
ncbi:MAG: PLP-dependent transferase [Rhizobiales bacterium]|nr:PLP-dependent transferase [Hyphomicrobiales bacterium]